VAATVNVVRSQRRRAVVTAVSQDTQTELDPLWQPQLVKIAEM